MSNGLGAGFFGLTMLAVLLGLAGVLALTGAATLAVERWADLWPAPLRYMPVVLLAAVAAVAGFCVLALYDEAAVLAWLFAALVVAPLGAGGAYLRRSTSLGWPDALSVTALGWSPSYVAGVVATFGLVTAVQQALQLTSGEVEQMGVAWAAAAAGGLLAVAGTAAVGGWFAGRPPWSGAARTSGGPGGTSADEGLTATDER